MVPQPESVARQRIRALADLDNRNNSFASLPANQPRTVFRRRKPLVTYGKKATSLSLTGLQFVKDNSTFDTQSEREESDEDRDVNACANQEAATGRLDRAVSSSLCTDESDEEVQSLHFRRASSRAHERGAPKAAPTADDHSTDRARREPMKCASPGHPKPAQTSRLNDGQGRVSKAKAKAKAAERERPRRRKTVSRNRHLPVNELFLTTSPLRYLTILTPSSSVPGIQTQDPIQDASQAPAKRDHSDSDEREQKTSRSKAPLSATRKRLKTPDPKRVALPARKRKRKQWDSHYSTTSSASKSGDGFEDHELRVAQAKPQTVRKRRCRPTGGYAPLQMSVGPLPQVEFGVFISGLEMVLDADTATSKAGWSKKPLASPSEQARATHRMRRAVSFSDREDLIMAQLSSISAPARPRSESDDSELDMGDEDEVVCDDHQSESLGDVSEDDEGSIENLSSDVDDSHVAPQSAQTEYRNQGISLEFRTPGTCDPRKGRLSGKLRLIEVAEAIRDDPDDLAQQEWAHLSTRAPQRLGHASPSRPLQMARNSGIPDVPQQTRPRSILKNSTPIIPDSTTGPQRTAANTRRNTAVAIAPNESRYFNDAADILRESDPPKHIIVPRRPSYFEHDTVEVVDSDGCVPETSPSAFGYTGNSQLHVLRKTSEAAWVSKDPLKTTKDLKALTRSTSRDYGTLSQSLRRRPSLPFQSPTKVH